MIDGNNLTLTLENSAGSVLNDPKCSKWMQNKLFQRVKQFKEWFFGGVGTIFGSLKFSTSTIIMGDNHGFEGRKFQTSKNRPKITY